MVDSDGGLYRPSDQDLLRAALRRLAARSGINVLFAGLVTDNALTITEFVGTATGSLDRLFVQPGEGVGGGAMQRARPMTVADYLDAHNISHQHDEAVRREGLRSMVALPVIVEGAPRAVLYAATRERAPMGDRPIDGLVEGARAIGREITIRDEVDRRLSVLRGASELPDASDAMRELREAVRAAHGELVALASATEDPEVAQRILAVTDQLLGGARPVDAPALSRREIDVLSQVALGCTYREAARRLSLQPDTVKGYMQSVMAKLRVHSRHEAVVAARRSRLIP